MFPVFAIVPHASWMTDLTTNCSDSCVLFFISFIAGMNTGTGKQLSRKSFSLGMFSTKCHHTLSDDTRCYSDETKWCEQSYFKAATHQSKLQLPKKPSPPLALSLPSFSTSSTGSFTALNFTKHSCEADLTCNYGSASVYLLQTPWISGHLKKKKKKEIIFHCIITSRFL